MGLLMIAALVWASIPPLGLLLDQSAVFAVALLSTLSLVCLTAWGGLGQMERQLCKGRDVPARNLPEKK